MCLYNIFFHFLMLIQVLTIFCACLNRRIHEKLMSLQLSELSHLRDFLTRTEDEMSKISNSPFDVSRMQEKHSELSRNIIEMQSRVISLSDLVLVVDSNSDQQNGNESSSSLIIILH